MIPPDGVTRITQRENMRRTEPRAAERRPEARACWRGRSPVDDDGFAQQLGILLSVESCQELTKGFRPGSLGGILGHILAATPKSNR
jgi:hypothetical protein